MSTITMTTITILMFFNFQETAESTVPPDLREIREPQDLMDVSETRETSEPSERRV